MRPVEWARQALDDLTAIAAFISAENPDAADRVADRIDQAAASLGGFAIGRKGPRLEHFREGGAGLAFHCCLNIRRTER